MTPLSSSMSAGVRSVDHTTLSRTSRPRRASDASSRSALACTRSPRDQSTPPGCDESPARVRRCVDQDEPCLAVVRTHARVVRRADVDGRVGDHTRGPRRTGRRTPRRSRRGTAPCGAAAPVCGRRARAGATARTRTASYGPAPSGHGSAAAPGSRSAYRCRASTSDTTTSAGTCSPSRSRTPSTRPPTTLTAVTCASKRNDTPRCAHRRASASASSRSPPCTCHAPKVCSTYGMTHSAAGARRGSEPV